MPRDYKVFLKTSGYSACSPDVPSACPPAARHKNPVSK